MTNSEMKRVHLQTVLQRNPWGNNSEAERDIQGADGRWLLRGAAEQASRLRQDRLLQRKGMVVLNEVPGREAGTNRSGITGLQLVFSKRGGGLFLALSSFYY